MILIFYGEEQDCVMAKRSIEKRFPETSTVTTDTEPLVHLLLKCPGGPKELWIQGTKLIGKVPKGVKVIIEGREE